MTWYLLDCNHFSEALQRVSVVRDRIKRLRRRGHRFITCHQVVCELEVGIQQSSRLHENRVQLKRLLQDIKVWPLTDQTTQDYGAIFLELKRNGRQLSQTDIILAALARRHKLTIFSTDRDFETLPDLSVENWLAP